MTAKKKNVKVSKGQNAVDEQVRKYAEKRQEVVQSLKAIEQDVIDQTAQQLGIEPEAIPDDLRIAEKVFDRQVPQLPFGKEDQAEPLKDSDPMPFGKHKGTPMKDVPSTYLDWLRDQDWLKDKYPRVLAYIREVSKFIDSELGDD